MEIRALNSSNLAELMNLPAHDLGREELITILRKIFESEDLVAYKAGRGYFSPTRKEIEDAMNESSAFSQRSKNTFYGCISAASERFNELKAVWEEEIFNRNLK